MSLVQKLPTNNLDIVGDIHGEYDALESLLKHLGYEATGHHPEGRILAFVGDFCDRGPDSPAVLRLVQSLVESDRAVAVLGNHEINLLREEAKDGSGWFFDDRFAKDYPKYAPFARPNLSQRKRIVDFLTNLPIALEREDLRIIHAAWQPSEIAMVRTLPLGSVRDHYDKWEEKTKNQAIDSQLVRRVQAELENWEHGLENRDIEPPFMHALADLEASKQMMNPIKVLTSGVERKGLVPFYSSGKWRFVDRVQWWDSYEDTTPVVIGHYWRRLHQVDRTSIGKGDPDLFENTHPNAWHGKNGNVFCVDFSAGGRWTERKSGVQVGTNFKLAALRWPERVLQFDDGRVMHTVNFQD